MKEIIASQVEYNLGAYARFNLLDTGYPETGTFTHREDPNEMIYTVC